jgi:hypothetical protein
VFRHRLVFKLALLLASALGAFFLFLLANELPIESTALTVRTVVINADFGHGPWVCATHVPAILLIDH